MRKSILRSRLLRLAMIGSGSALVLDGCDVNVRDTVLTGVGGAATDLASTFIEAFIQSLQNDADTPATV